MASKAAKSPATETRGKAKALRCVKCHSEGLMGEGRGGMCRQCLMDEKLEVLAKKLEDMEGQLAGAQLRIDELENENKLLKEEQNSMKERCSERSLVQEAEVVEAKTAVDGVVSDCRKMAEDQEAMGERISRLEWAIEVGSEDVEEDLNRTWTSVVDGSNKSKQRKFPEKGKVDVQRKTGASKNTEAEERWSAIGQEQKIVVIGSSMAIGVGEGLKRQHGNVKLIAKRGGMIADVVNQLENAEMDEEEQVVVLVGGNNVDRGDGTEEIMSEYGRLFGKLKDKKATVTVVGPNTRGHFGPYLHSKVIGINRRLKEICQRNGMYYVEAGLTEAEKYRLLVEMALILTDIEHKKLEGWYTRLSSII